MLAACFCVTEGTYPYHWGGVSTWCHSLTHELSEIEFVLLALARDPLHRAAVRAGPERRRAPDDPAVGGPEGVTTCRGGGGPHGVVDRRVRPALPELRRPAAGRPPERRRPRPRDPRDVPLLPRSRLRRRVPLARDLGRVRARRSGHELGRATSRSRISRRRSTACITGASRSRSAIPRTDVVHAAMVGVSTLVAAAAKLEHRVPVLLSEHGIYLRERYLAEHASKESSVPQAAQARVRPADDRAQLRPRGHRLAVLRLQPPLGASQRRGSGEARDDVLRGRCGHVRTERDAPAGPPVVTWAGRFHPIKDIETLLRAAALVHARPARCPVQAVRKQPGGHGAVPSIAASGCTASSVWTGRSRSRTSGRTRPSMFGDADLVVLTSISEGFPFTTLEAMLCGKPVVATAVGGVREQVPPSCGVTVGPRDPEAMAARSSRSSTIPDACAERGRAARIWAASMFGIDRFRSSHYALYGRLLHDVAAVERLGTARLGRTATSQRSTDCRLRAGRRRRRSRVACRRARRSRPAADRSARAHGGDRVARDHGRARGGRYGARDTFELGERAYASLVERRVQGTARASPQQTRSSTRRARRASSSRTQAVACSRCCRCSSCWPRSRVRRHGLERRRDPGAQPRDDAWRRPRERLRPGDLAPYLALPGLGSAAAWHAGSSRSRSSPRRSGSWRWRAAVPPRAEPVRSVLGRGATRLRRHHRLRRPGLVHGREPLARAGSGLGRRRARRRAPGGSGRLSALAESSRPRASSGSSSRSASWCCAVRHVFAGPPIPARLPARSRLAPNRPCTSPTGSG